MFKINGPIAKQPRIKCPCSSRVYKEVYYNYTIILCSNNRLNSHSLTLWKMSNKCFFPSHFLSDPQSVLCTASGGVHICGFEIILYLLSLVIVLPPSLCPRSVWRTVNSLQYYFYLAFLYPTASASDCRCESDCCQNQGGEAGKLCDANLDKAFPTPTLR